MTEPAIYRLDLKNKNTLHIHYMPFIVHGGIFIITDDKLKLKQKVILKLSLATEEMTINGCVVWMNPPDSQRGDQPGYGIQIRGENKRKQHHIIRSCLGKRLDEMPMQQIY